jgi:hypothetical protein
MISGLQHRGAPGQRRRHQQVLGGADRDQRELDHGALQAVRRLGIDIAVGEVKLGAQLFKPMQVQIDGPRADGAAAGQRNLGMTVAREHRPQHQNRGAHLAHDVVMGGVVGDATCIQRQHPALRQACDLAAQRSQKFGHGGDIGQPGGIGQGQRLVGQQGGGHQRQAGVLRPRDLDGAVERPSAGDCDLVHSFCPFLRGPVPGPV